MNDGKISQQSQTKIIFIFALLSLSLLSAGCVLAEDVSSGSAPVSSSGGRPMRLSRPGEFIPTKALPVPSSLPVGGHPFSLGVEEKHLGPEPTSLSGNSQSQSLAPATAFPSNVMLKGQSGLFGDNPSLMFKSNASANSDANSRQQKLSGGASSLQVLSNYDLELIVDASLSMRKHDCPNDMSRWDWCGMQTTELARKLAPFTPRGLTLTSFASEFHVYPNSSPANIADLFNNPAFMWGTHLAEPLDNRLNDFFARRKPGSKPMLIAVITDGVPAPHYEPQMVVDILVAATKQMRDPRELTVVFLQIGPSELKGKQFLDQLDTGLVAYGAKYDIVRTYDFDQVQKLGLAQALVQSIQEFAAKNDGAGAVKP